jgi:hypothetical protein
MLIAAPEFLDAVELFLPSGVVYFRIGGFTHAELFLYSGGPWLGHSNGYVGRGLENCSHASVVGEQCGSAKHQSDSER